MHGVIPVLFIVAVEAARHAIGRIADITADKHMEGVRLTRWLLSPVPTFPLWRRMKLWELRSYDQVIKLEQERLVYRARLHSRFGRAWRRKAPVESLMPLRLARYGVPLADTAPAGLAAAGIEPTPIPPPTQWEAANADPAADTEPATSGDAAKPRLAATKATLPSEENSTLVSHTPVPQLLHASRPGLKAEPELEPHPQVRTRAGQQAGRSLGSRVHGSPAASQHTTSREPLGAQAPKEHIGHSRALLTEGSNEQAHDPTPRMTTAPDAAGPARPTRAYAHHPDPTTGTRHAEPTDRNATTAPGCHPLSPEQRCDHPSALQRPYPRPAAAATHDQLAHTSPTHAAARWADTTQPRQTLQTSSSVRQSQDHRADGNLTLPDRYYLAWMDYQNHRGTEPTGQELSAHLWANQRVHAQVPSHGDIARECARQDITAQYNKPITTTYIARLTADFERRRQALNSIHSH